MKAIEKFYENLVYPRISREELARICSFAELYHIKLFKDALIAYTCNLSRNAEACIERWYDAYRTLKLDNYVYLEDIQDVRYCGNIVTTYPIIKKMSSKEYETMLSFWTGEWTAWQLHIEDLCDDYSSRY